MSAVPEGLLRAELSNVTLHGGGRPHLDRFGREGADRNEAIEEKRKTQLGIGIFAHLLFSDGVLVMRSVVSQRRL